MKTRNIRSVSRFVRVGDHILNMEHITRIDTHSSIGGGIVLTSDNRSVSVDRAQLAHLLYHLDMADEER